MVKLTLASAVRTLSMALILASELAMACCTNSFSLLRHLTLSSWICGVWSSCSIKEEGKGEDKGGEGRGGEGMGRGEKTRQGRGQGRGEGEEKERGRGRGGEGEEKGRGRGGEGEEEGRGRGGGGEGKGRRRGGEGEEEGRGRGGGVGRRGVGSGKRMTQLTRFTSRSHFSSASLRLNVVCVYCASLQERGEEAGEEKKGSWRVGGEGRKEEGQERVPPTCSPWR